VRVIVVTGAGSYFCTGMDLGGGDQASMSQKLDEGISFYERLRNCKKPLVARINGPALGGGWLPAFWLSIEWWSCVVSLIGFMCTRRGLVFAADIRVATKDAWFCFSEVKRGLVPAVISAYIVPQIGVGVP